jgi:16S rRNA (cytosine1402-N4)-methyltransferase
VEIRHQSVLLAECLSGLAPRPGETWVDTTCGGGGHTIAIAEAVGPTGQVIALDQDASMLVMAASRLAGRPIITRHANFDQLASVLADLNVTTIHGLLADLGFSSDQMDDPGRGLSFRTDGPLDMRLNRDAGPSAADIVNGWDEKTLADTIFEYGEERLSRRIARKIVERRVQKPFATTGDLAHVIRSCVPRSGGIDPATRTFQALRIAVNDELGALERLLSVLPEVLAEGGRVGIISFHSLEDRRVKQAFKASPWQAVTKKPIEAGSAEIAANPRARSAKLRIAIMRTMTTVKPGD